MTADRFQSMRRFMRNRLVLVALLLSCLFGAALFTVYEWGLDDTSEFYLYADAEAAETTWRANAPLPQNSLLKQYYWGLEALPPRYRVLFDFPLESPVITHLQDHAHFDYVLAYPLSGDDVMKTLFVVHSFSAEQDSDLPGMTVGEVFFMLLLIAIGSATLLAGVFTRDIDAALNSLREWVESLSTSAKEPVIAPPSALRFSELHAVGNRLLVAIQRINQLTEHEKHFVRSLSHELRTPMAIVRAALDLMEKRELPPDLASKIGKIRDANRKMIAIADTLLRLWGSDAQREPPSAFVLSELIDDVLSEVSQAGLDGGTRIHKSVPAEQWVTLPREALSVVIINVLKNAMQYTCNGELSIECSTGNIIVKNKIDTAQKNSRVSSATYGFGLGLFIVNTLADRYGWQTSYLIDDGYFVAAIAIA